MGPTVPLTPANQNVSRSVYLHNNKLTDGGLPDGMFNASDNLEILTMSSNFLRTVPKNLPPSLYRLHLKVAGGMPSVLGGESHTDVAVSLHRATSWRKSQPEPSTACGTYGSFTCKTTS